MKNPAKRKKEKLRMLEAGEDSKYKCEYVQKKTFIHLRAFPEPCFLS